MIGGGLRVAPFLHLSATRCFHRVHGAPSIHGLKGSAIKVAAPVASTLRCRGPVVALESAIITHGMPYPDNLQTALKVEQIIRDAGATPATIGVVSGRVIVGMSVDQMERLARHDNPSMKTSRRDLPVVLAEGRDGGTTVSGTLVVAARLGIPVFVTGGIGGVHRGAENSMDVSADLIELGRCSVCVVSAGVKSILDIGRTLEVLETQGVCVATLGPRRSFPAFFTDCSGHVSPHSVNNCADAAAILYHHRQLALESGVLLSVPIPAKHQTSGQRIESAIQQALAEADEAAIVGRDLTPFILSRVNQLTDGESLRANKHLIENNAVFGAQIAVEFCKLLKAGEKNDNLSATGDNSNVGPGKLAVVISSRGESAGGHLDDSSRDVVTALATSSGQQAVQEVPPEAIRSGSSAAHQNEQSMVDERTSLSSDETEPHGFNKPANLTATSTWSGHISPPLVVVGGSAMDFTIKLNSDLVQMDGSTYCGEVWRGPGGVARNMADALTRLGHSSVLISAVGDDSLGYDLVSSCTHMDWSAVARSPSSRTASYTVTLNQQGRVMYVVGDMLAHQNISPHLIDSQADMLTASPLVVTDGDTPIASLRQVALHCQSSGAAVWFDPADTCHAHKVTALVSCTLDHSRPFLLYASPNLAELQAIHRIFFPDAALEICGFEGEDLVTACMHAAVDIMHHFYCLIVTLGPRGVMVLRRGSPELALCLRTSDAPPLERKPCLEPEKISCVFYPVESESRVMGESGTGDCLNAGFISGLLSGFDQLRCVSLGLSAARQALCVRQAVPTSLHLPKTPACAHAHILLPSAAQT